MTDTIFGKIARGEIPVDLVYEDEDVVAFRDISPQAPVHLLIIPRKPIPTLNDAGPEDAELIGKLLLAAARVGGIHANNTYRADFIYENLMVECNVVHAAFKAGVERLLFLGSSCIYPRSCPQPMKEEYLLSGPLEPTNEPYAIAKIAGIKLCESYNRQYGRDYRSVMPTNLYGPGDNYHPTHSHVIPGLLRKFHEARVRGEDTVTVWGTGTPRREFLFSDDMADACLFLMNLPEDRYTALLGSDALRAHLAEEEKALLIIS